MPRLNTFPDRTALETPMRYLLTFAVLFVLAPAFAADAPAAAAKPYPLKTCIISAASATGYSCARAR